MVINHLIIGGAWGFRNNIFKTAPVINNFYRMELQNGVFDEIKIDENIDVIYSSNKEEWGYDTVFDYKTNNNNLEAGNVDNKGVPIEKILFQKRKKDELEWTNVAVFDFNAMQKVYEVVDRYIINNCSYEFCVCPLTASIVGERGTIEVTPKFEDLFLTDKENNIRLKYNLEHSDIENVNNSITYETLGSSYPIISYSSLNYRKGSVRAMLVSDIDINQNDMNPYEEKKYRDKILKFLKNHKPKLFRAYNGEYLMVTCINSPKFTPENNLGGIIGNISFDWIEVDSTDSKSLKNNGFI